MPPPTHILVRPYPYSLSSCRPPPPPPPPPAWNQPIDLDDVHVVDAWGVYYLLVKNKKVITNGMTAD